MLQENRYWATIKENASNGTISDFDGNFCLGVSPSSVLQIFIYWISESDYKNQMGNQPLSITLKKDTQTLEEVVVVGYGVQKKANLTGLS